MEKVLAYAISILIIGFGLWIFVDGFSWGSPAFEVAAIVSISVGFLSLLGPT
jgi:hypothetical protein